MRALVWQIKGWLAERGLIREEITPLIAQIDQLMAEVKSGKIQYSGNTVERAEIAADTVEELTPTSLAEAEAGHARIGARLESGEESEEP